MNTLQVVLVCNFGIPWYLKYATQCQFYGMLIPRSDLYS